MSLRKHPLICVGSLIPFAVLDYLPYLLPRFGNWLASLNPDASINYASLFSFENPWVTFVIGIYWIFVWMGAFGTFTNYFLDQWIVTNERIIMVNQVSFFYREFSSLFLDRVQDVKIEIGGFFQTLFGFGTVEVESAGANAAAARMAGLSHPTTVRDLVLAEVGKLHRQAPTTIVGGV